MDKGRMSLRREGQTAQVKKTSIPSPRIAELYQNGVNKLSNFPTGTNNGDSECTFKPMTYWGRQKERFSKQISRKKRTVGVVPQLQPHMIRRLPEEIVIRKDETAGRAPSPLGFLNQDMEDWPNEDMESEKSTSNTTDYGSV